MRIWSLHPKYLDPKGIVALWRETLLAKKVLEGKTKGYRNHPQLLRFIQSESALDAINQYLSVVYQNSQERGYHFDKSKIDWEFRPQSLQVTEGQLNYELNHLLNKLKKRDPGKFEGISREPAIDSHPLFQVIDGEIEYWEIL